MQYTTTDEEDESKAYVRVGESQIIYEHCLAVVDGEPVSLVARSGVVDLVEAVNAIVLKK